MGRKILVIAFSLGLLAVGPARAAPVTYTFTGTLDSSYTISTSGTLAGLFSAGDSFTLTSTVDQDGPPDIVSSGGSHGSHYFYQQWVTGNEQTLTINGHTFSVADAQTGYDHSRAEADIGHGYDYIWSLNYDNTPNHFNNPGGATSSLSNVDYVYIEWYLYDNDGLNDILDFADPRFPETIDLADWIGALVHLYVQDNNASGTQVGFAQFYDAQLPVFDSVTAGGGGGAGVPAPGALALVGLGLLGLGLRRRVT